MGLWNGWIWFLRARADSRRTEGRGERYKYTRAMYFPLRGEVEIWHIIGVFLNIEKELRAICAFVSILPEESPKVVNICKSEINVSKSCN